MALVPGLAFGLQACGEDAPRFDAVPRSWNAGDIDPYGCPFIKPVAWIIEEAHRATCGPGCEPLGADGAFVACVGDDVPRYPDEVILGLSLCMTHPVDGQDYEIWGEQDVWPLRHLCWRDCGTDAPLRPGQWREAGYDAPAECFED